MFAPPRRVETRTRPGGNVSRITWMRRGMGAKKCTCMDGMHVWFGAPRLPTVWHVPPLTLRPMQQLPVLAPPVDASDAGPSRKPPREKRRSPAAEPGRRGAACCAALRSALAAKAHDPDDTPVGMGGGAASASAGG